MIALLPQSLRRGVGRDVLVVWAGEAEALSVAAF